MLLLMRLSIAVLSFLTLMPAARAQWVNLLAKDLTGWEVAGDGVWSVMADGTLLGQRDTRKPKSHYDPDQSWLYSKREFGEFDLHLEWWTRINGNSGVSLLDTSRARYSFGPEADPKRTPSHIGYEIQISVGDSDPFPSGSVYLFDKAKTGFQLDHDWNSFDIENHADGIRVSLNGHLVSQYAGAPGRSKTGPIGLQLHDRTGVAMFRNIRIREIQKP